MRRALNKKLADKPPEGSRSIAPTTALWLAAMAAIAGFAGVYVTLGRSDNADSSQSHGPGAIAEALPPAADGAPAGPSATALNRGQMAAFVFKQAPQDLPEARFQDAGGRERSLADWRGKVVLVNLWATWCIPCRKEMPALDRLQMALGSGQFEVVAISVDRTGLPGARKFLDEAKVERLALYADATARLASTLQAVGLPATILLNSEGREVGRLLGGAAWDSDDAKRLIASVMR
jgi:thiol-disulfide isomerase/thioredoxin